jgi:hypothetical protein
VRPTGCRTRWPGSEKLDFLHFLTFGGVTARGPSVRHPLVVCSQLVAVVLRPAMGGTTSGVSPSGLTIVGSTYR